MDDLSQLVLFVVELLDFLPATESRRVLDDFVMVMPYWSSEDADKLDAFNSAASTMLDEEARIFLTHSFLSFFTLTYCTLSAVRRREMCEEIAEVHQNIFTCPQ